MPRPQTSPEQALAAKLARLDEDSTLCVTSLPHIRDLMPEPDVTGPQTGTIGRHAPESSEPWQGQAAAVYWTIHYGARRLEVDLREQLGLPPVQPARGGSEANTISALLAIPRLATTLPGPAVAIAGDVVSRWVRLIDQLDPHRGLDNSAPDWHWRPLPKRDGRSFACPYCETFALRLNIARMTVRCFNTGCRDGDDQPPVARAAHDRLVFRDGHVVDYRELAEIPA